MLQHISYCLTCSDVYQGHTLKAGLKFLRLFSMETAQNAYLITFHHIT
jgi:hypothetical protein